MTKLDLVLERIRKLPQERQDAIAMDLELWLEEDDGALSEAQEQELRRRLSDPNRQYLSHEDVREFFEKKYGR